MKELLIVILLVFIFSGCAKTIYYHPYKDASDFEQDYAACQYEAEKYGYIHSNTPQFGGMGAAVASGFGAGIEEALRKNKIIKMCLQQKGWHK